MAVCRLPSLSLADSRDSSSPDQDPADVPTRILYDNTRLAVARILGDGERKKTRAFSELQSHHLFAEKFGRPGKGNDKGKIENLVGFARRNFMVPIPHAANWEELNARLEADCRRRRECRLRGHTETIGERFERDRAAMLPLPPTSYEACEKVTARVSSLSLVRYRTNDYSVPTQYGHRQVLVKGYVHRVEIGCASEVIARHARSYQRETAVYDPLHYLALLEHIPSLNKALVLELARCEFLNRKENLLFLGNSGTGKSHLALALGLVACQRGHRVRFTTAAALVSELIEARDEKHLLRFQKQLAAYELLIVDELGFVPLSKTGAELLFEIFSQRYERASVLVTSNLPFHEWTEVFGSERLTGALLDRLTHHVHLLEMNGDSYRLKQSRRKRNPPADR